MIDNNIGYKKEISNIYLLDEHIIRIFEKLHSKEFISSLEYITGIKNLIADKELYGGGIVNTPSKGYLKLHADFNYYDKIKLYRRLNLVIYLNEYWDKEWNGNLEIWDKNLKEKVKVYEPLGNNFILFRVTDNVYHGYPDPLKCPEDTNRKSINIYYYTKENDIEQSIEPHKTIWKI